MNDTSLTSDDVIEALVQALSGTGAIDRAMLTQALEGLVRLAQAEQLLRMQLDFNRATSPPGPRHDGLARA